MNITDEKLSAFLDAELPETEMEAIRDCLINDENLANRLAELAIVDEVVSLSYSTIDAHPIPNSVNALLVEDKPEATNIIAFPRMRKFQQLVQQHAAIAASIALVIGFGLSQSLQKNSVDAWQTVAQVLETAPSGVEHLAESNVQIKPRLTFIDKNGDYCRQFVMTQNRTVTENIACRKNNTWQLTATVYVDKIAESGTYQTASGSSLLDSTVDQMANGEFFNAQAESAAIEQHWSAK